jgi:hypothetical protein
MLNSSTIVTTKSVCESRTDLLSFACGWLSSKAPWFLVTYNDDEEEPGSPTSDMLIGSVDLAILLPELAGSITRLVFVHPRSDELGSGWTFDVVSEFWASEAPDVDTVLIISFDGTRFSVGARKPSAVSVLHRLYPF